MKKKIGMAMTWLPPILFNLFILSDLGLTAGLQLLGFVAAGLGWYWLSFRLWMSNGGNP